MILSGLLCKQDYSMLQVRQPYSYCLHLQGNESQWIWANSISSLQLHLFCSAVWGFVYHELTKFVSSLHHLSALFIPALFLGFLHSFRCTKWRIIDLFCWLSSLSAWKGISDVVPSDIHVILKFQSCFQTFSSELFPWQCTVILSAEFEGGYSLSTWKIKGGEGV